MNKELTEKQKVGNLGEDLACEFLRRQGHSIVDRNYRKKWGEIDIVSKKDDILHFVEVKTNSVREGFKELGYRPEENVRSWKMKRMSRAIRTYLLDKRVSDEQELEVDVMAVLLDFSSKKAKIRIIPNVLLNGGL